MKHIKLFEGFLNEIDLDDLERKVNRLRGQKYRPSDYNDIVIWNAIRDRKAPTVIGGNYAVPTDYHAKMRYFKMFESNDKF